MCKEIGFYITFTLQACAACIENNFSQIDSLRSRNPYECHDIVITLFVHPQHLFLENFHYSLIIILFQDATAMSSYKRQNQTSRAQLNSHSTLFTHGAT